MFRVLIADDENSVIQSLVGSVPWVELGLVVAATASDGREAGPEGAGGRGDH